MAVFSEIVVGLNQQQSALFNLKFYKMKTNVFLMLCIFIGITSISVSAQDKANKAEQGWFTTTYWSPVYCDGEMVDLLKGGELRVHYVFRFVNNGLIVAKEIDQIKGSVTSVSGEVFKIRETDKYFKTDHWEVTWHYNLIGDQGNHYIGWITMNFLTNEITVGKTVCN